ncbi:lysophospholipid acyltransferase family protein [Dietzia sp. 179-F 9C3 NHS]|uniref:lysophospholipid acyltransferase family protein n=1 Tax=Dietzia sp. 179-F 9C3 NHS TaxID=3374295 RepID=UPI003879FC04
MRGPEFDLSQPLGGPRWGEGRRDSRSDRVVGEGFLGATTHSDAAATEIGRIVDRFLTSMRSAIRQVMEVLPIDQEILAPVKEAAKNVDVALATGDVSRLSGLVDAINVAGDVLATRITGGYEVDEFGFDPHFHSHVWLPLWRPLFEHWFRVEVIGAENIPENGAGLIVSNHAGVLPLDGLMTTVAVHDHGGRALRLLAADLAMTLPVSAPFARRAGATLACAADAERLLEGGHVVAVWPEGFKGLGKPFADRYRLQRFGRGGFVSTAIAAGAPIIPCSVVGSEEIYPKLGEIPALARLLGVPYLPITPTFPLLGGLGGIPLPTKWTMEFGEPIETAHLGAEAAEDPMVVFELTDQVRETIQNTLFRNLARRGSVFFG